MGRLSEWEEYRLAVASSAPTKPVSYEVIKAAVKALRFCKQYQNLVDELAFRNCSYNGPGSEIKYDQVLQGLVNVNLGSAALSLEEQLSRGVASLSGLVSSSAQAEAELAEILMTEEVWQRKLNYAEMNPTTTESELQAIRQQVERISDARDELQERVRAEKAATEAEQDDDDDGEPVRELTDLEKAELKAETAQALADRLQAELAEAVSNILATTWLLHCTHDAGMTSWCLLSSLSDCGCFILFMFAER
eukprot:COSAG02_NODE_1716_length_11210_cov_24.482495_4_plen_250_part_00